MSKIVEILAFEEGYKESPYIDTQGYPTVAGGIRIGPKGVPVSSYTFTVPRAVGDVWLQNILDAKIVEMKKIPSILSALNNCDDARADILYSMAYNMGVAGLSGFKNTLAMIAAGNFSGAAQGMLNSLWAKQVPNRSSRHAQVMASGTYDAYKGKI